MEGYVYAWKVPIGVRATVDGTERLFFIVKVGKSGNSSVLQRLQTENLAWKKLMTKKKAGVPRYEYDRDVDIPFGTASVATRLLLAKNASWKQLCNHYQSELSDLCFLVHCSPDQKSNVNDTETLARSLLGPPLPTEILKEAIETYNRIERVHRPTPGGIDQSQIAPTEYCLVDAELFSETRRSFLKLCKNSHPFGSIPFTDVLGLLTSRRAESLHACGIDVSAFLRFRRSYKVPQVVVRVRQTKTRPSLRSLRNSSSSDEKGKPADERSEDRSPLSWSRAELVDFFMKRHRPRDYGRFCETHNIYLETLRRYVDYQKYPFLESASTEIALANFAVERLRKRGKRRVPTEEDGE